MYDNQAIPQEKPEYAGFWIRVVAAIIDSILVTAITLPFLLAIYGMDYLASEEGPFIWGPADFLISWVLPAIAIILFWMYRQATPGKMVFSCKVLDARTGNPPSKGQLIGRYLGYFISVFPLCLGLLWVAFDKKKQGWHDKLAGTVVVRTKPEKQPPAFE